MAWAWNSRTSTLRAMRGIELDGLAVAEQRVGAQGGAQAGQCRTQRPPGLQFRCIAPVELGEDLAGVAAGVEDEVGEQAFFFARRQPDGAAVLLEVEPAEK